MDLNNILLSQRIHDTWLAYTQIAVDQLRGKYADLKASEIPDEQFRILPDGTGEVYVRVRESELVLRVPKDEYRVKDL